MKKIFTILFTAFASLSFAQSPDIEWQKSLGGSYGDGGLFDAGGNTIVQTTDGGYIVSGATGSNDGDVSGNHGNFDYWIVKLSNSGNMEWQKSLGGSDLDNALSIAQTTDGGYIVAGFTTSIDGDVTGNHGNSDYWIVKLNNNGSIKWQKSFGGSNGDQAYSIAQTTDGGYIVAGNSYSNDGDVTGSRGNGDYWIVKLDNEGNIGWQKSLGGSSTDLANSIAQTTDGGYIVAGYTYSNDGDISSNHGQYDYWIVKLTDTGNIEWQKSLGGYNYDEASSIKQTSDGGYIVAGGGGSNDGDETGNHGSYDFWIVKLNNSGSIEWQKSLGGYYLEKASSIVQTADEGYIVAGSTESTDGDISSNHGNYDYWIVKLTDTGNIEWQKSLGGSSTDYANCIIQTIDGGYAVAGMTSSNDGDVTINHGNYDYWIVKLKPEGALPLTLLSFTATIQQTKVLLSWVTTNEINNDYFTIERSNNNKDFIDIGMVISNTQPQPQNNYSFTDNLPLTGTSYYRLKQTDKDGKFTFSKIIPVNVAAIYKMLIKPNPSANGIFNIDLGTVRNNIAVTITDNNGRQVYKQQLTSAQNININLANTARGIYYLKVDYDGGMETGKLVVE